MQLHIEVMGPELHVAARGNVLGSSEWGRGRSRPWNEMGRGKLLSAWDEKKPVLFSSLAVP